MNNAVERYHLGGNAAGINHRRLKFTYVRQILSKAWYYSRPNLIIIVVHRWFAIIIALQRSRHLTARPSIPAIGELTVCEINCELLTTKDESDSQAKDAYAKTLGRVFHPIHFQVEEGLANASRFSYEQKLDRQGANIVASSSEGTDDVQEGLFSKGMSTVTKILGSSLGPLFPPHDIKILKRFELLQGISWHRHKHFLAFIYGPNQVTVHGFEDSEWQESSVLNSESHRGECGIQVVLESSNHNDWTLSVKLNGLTKYTYKAQQLVQSGTTNRYTHAMIWKGGKEQNSTGKATASVHPQFAEKTFRMSSIMLSGSPCM